MDYHVVYYDAKKMQEYAKTENHDEILETMKNLLNYYRDNNPELLEKHKNDLHNVLDNGF